MIGELGYLKPIYCELQFLAHQFPLKLPLVVLSCEYTGREDVISSLEQVSTGKPFNTHTLEDFFSEEGEGVIRDSPTYEYLRELGGLP